MLSLCCNALHNVFYCSLIVSVSFLLMYTSSCWSILQYLTIYVVFMCVVLIFKFCVLFCCVYWFTAHQYLLSVMSGSAFFSPYAITCTFLMLCRTNTFSVFIAPLTTKKLVLTYLVKMDLKSFNVLNDTLLPPDATRGTHLQVYWWSTKKSVSQMTQWGVVVK